MSIRYLAVLSVLFLASVSCTVVNPEKEAIQNLIGRYNSALIMAHKGLNMEPLKAVTVESHFNRINTIINAYLDGDEIMDSEFLKLAFNDIKIEGDAARVRTSEDWKYRWINYKTGQEIEPLKDIHYEMVYHLIKKDKKWLVEKTEDVK